VPTLAIVDDSIQCSEVADDVTLVLEPIFEADLQPEQYAYRADRSALDAVQNVRLYSPLHSRQGVLSVSVFTTAVRPFPS
jgi:hypothetical protein